MSAEHASIAVTQSPACWSCGGPVEAGAPFCGACQAVQPPGQMDHFARLGLQCGYGVDPAVLDRAYFALQRQLHPDRFARRQPRERAISQQQAAALNEAYETLKHPIRRARYLAGQMGVDLPGDGRTIDDPALLMEAMEGREALSEADSVSAVQALERKSRDERAAEIDALSDLFAQADHAGIRHAILRLAYLDKFVEEARARRLNMGSAGP
ncbi:MAG: Fe-S protein assembly co-chaperone HscB [Alphaproteobacteria bacterium]|nr:Fe-S protein assembly co-chaperone HscB [Alphaproteobacteria bacterium]MCW5740249.1 Fe-S protein assembly co-chaperone HscB [Alphaproteobacteria bacterium]